MPKKRGVGRGACASKVRPCFISRFWATVSRQVCTRRGPTSSSSATWATGREQACVPIATRRRSVVRRRQPQMVSASVKLRRQVRHQKRRLTSSKLTCRPASGISRLRRTRRSWCLGLSRPQWEQAARSAVLIMVTSTPPSVVSVWLRIWKPGSPNGTRMLCAGPAGGAGRGWTWEGMVCWSGTAGSPPCMDVLLFLATKNQQEASFSSLSPSRMETRDERGIKEGIEEL
jgi:hypothetical protein